MRNVEHNGFKLFIFWLFFPIFLKSILNMLGPNTEFEEISPVNKEKKWFE